MHLVEIAKALLRQRQGEDRGKVHGGEDLHQAENIQEGKKRKVMMMKRDLGLVDFSPLLYGEDHGDC